MDDERLYGISIFCSVLGIIILYMLLQNANSDAINEFSDKEGESIQLIGKVKEIRSGNTSQIVLEHITKTKIIAFKSKDINLKVGDLILVNGKNSGENKEVFADRIDKII